MSNSFEDDNYFEKVFDIPKRNIDASSQNKAKTAFELAHDVRKFEIELFWKRGTYFWAFILASFTAYFVTFDKFLAYNKFEIKTLLEFSSSAKIVLLILSCMTFIFCLAWVFINKGSKFWQKNWEAHIDAMEDMFSGKLYKTILNTKNKDFSKSVFNKSAYDYSVTKITTVTSIILMILSAMLSIFHFVLLILDFWKYTFLHKLEFEVFALLLGFLILFLTGFAALELKNCDGNSIKNKNRKKWRQRN